MHNGEGDQNGGLSMTSTARASAGDPRPGDALCSFSLFAGERRDDWRKNLQIRLERDEV